MEKIQETAREIPVYYETDVVVVGGGPGGIGAALSAARNGASTILVEKVNCLGGIGTSGLSNGFMGVDFRVSAGIFKEICMGLKAEGGVYSETYQHYQVDIERYKYYLNRMMKSADVKVLFHSLAVDVIKEGNTVKGIVIECEEGRIAILAKVVIDASAYASMAERAGAETVRKENEFLVNAILFRGIDFNRLINHKNQNPDFVDNVSAAFKQPAYRAGMPWWPWSLIGGTKGIEEAVKRGELPSKDAISICIFPEEGPGRALAYIFKDGHGKTWALDTRSQEEFNMREQEWLTYEHLRKNVPGFENSAIEHTSNESRSSSSIFIGDYVLKGQDAFDGKVFDDSVAIGGWVYDHMEDRRMDVPLFDIPYRCLYSKNIENLMCAGVIVSTDFVAKYITWSMTTCMINGQASGTAAALAIKNGVSPRNVDVKVLQKILMDQGHNASKKYLPKEVNAEYDDYVEEKRRAMKEDKISAETRYW